MFSELILWSHRSFPHLPWRKNRSLYRTLVSEIMLQQTTVTTVLKHFERFVETFPDLKALAEASEEELLVAWKGLGYYRRAKNLKKIAESIVETHKGKFPRTVEALLEIPGIGPYTANALLAIGMDQAALAVDANLERVLARYYGIRMAKGPALQKDIQRRYEVGEVIPGRDLSFRDLNEALMDLGRTICQARKASCELCPLRDGCHGKACGKPLAFPMDGEAKKKAQSHELVLVRVVVRQGHKILVYQKEEGEWLSGQWEVPTFVVSTSDESLLQYPKLPKKLRLDRLPSVKTSITKYGIINHVLILSSQEWKKWKFTRKTSWREVGSRGNLSTASEKCLRLAVKSLEKGNVTL